MTRRIVPPVLIAFTLATSGCMSFGHGPQPPAGSWPLAAPPKRPRVSIVFRHEVEIVDQTQPPNPAAGEVLRDVVLRTYADANLFAGVRPGIAAGGGEIQADVVLRNYGRPNIGLAVLCGVTMGILPAVATDHFAMKTTVRDADGRVIAEADHEGEVTTWIELFLIFASAAAWPDTVVKGLVGDLTRVSIQDLHARGAW